MPRKLLVLSLLLFAACAPQTGNDSQQPWTANAGISEAHDAYLAGDWLRMLGAVRGVLADDRVSRVERANVLELLESAYAAGGSRLPSDWQLPAELERLTITQRYVANAEGAHYELSMQVIEPDQDTVKRMVLGRYPDVVVLDSDSPGAERDLDAEDDGRWELGVKSPDRDTPEAEGLYWLRLTLANGQTVDGWTIIAGLASSATPVLREPAAGQVYTTGTPRFSWDDFRSPEYAGFEARRLGVYIGTWDPTRETAWQDAWGFYPREAGATAITVGDQGGRGPMPVLADGCYHMGITFHEQRWLGPVRLRRTSQTSRSFTVKNGDSYQFSR